MNPNIQKEVAAFDKAFPDRDWQKLNSKESVVDHFTQALERVQLAEKERIAIAVEAINITADKPENEGIADMYRRFWEETFLPKVRECISPNQTQP
jgi:hypothetical protein